MEKIPKKTFHLHEVDAGSDFQEVDLLGVVLLAHQGELLHALVAAHDLRKQKSQNFCKLLARKCFVLGCIEYLPYLRGASASRLRSRARLGVLRGADARGSLGVLRDVVEASQENG